MINLRRALAVAVCVAGTLLATAWLVPAEAEVRFGRGVRIGGHDFSNQTFNSRRNARITLYRGQPRGAGCRWVRRPGGMTKVCHLQRR